MKRALVLSGGGSRGAYQVGVLKALLKLNLIKEYDMFCGVSVGALNSSFLGTYENFAEGVSDLEKIWLNLETRDIYKKWFLWPLSILWKPSVYNSSPLEDWVYDVLEGYDIVKPVTVGATSLKTGEYTTVRHTHSDFIPAVIASASYPGFFKPFIVNDEYSIDGGVRNVTPLKAAIEAGATHIDCIVLNSSGVAYSNKKPRAFNILVRSLNIMMDEIIENDLKVCQFINDQIEYDQDFLLQNKRHIELRIFRPYTDLDVNPLKFKPEVSEKLINDGYNDIVKKYGLSL